MNGIWLRSIRTSLFPLFLLLISTGCSSPVSIEIWQKSIEDYVWDEANGDPNALRNLTWNDSQKRFSIISEASPKSATDATGLLLAHRQVAGRPRFIFLVGLVRQREPEEIRLAALAVEGTNFTWAMSPRDPKSLQRYLAAREEAWKSLFPGRDDPPVSFLGFPGEGDLFEVHIEGKRVVAKHTQSGAQWILNVP